MPDIIQLLPDSIANQIAAGEVIQRPASVVKELMENALDAGSTYIRLILKDAGKTSIQVIDDGKGMSETDARMSFERHATSKIRSAHDLFSIKTMGFRGEALASIAAISHTEMTTRQAESDVAVRIIIEGSQISKHEKCQGAAGTSITVKNIFYNIPARRKFLKSDPVELKHIIEEFHRVALANPEIHFTLHHNGNELYHLPKSNLKQRIVGIFGKNINDKLVPVTEETEVAVFSGLVGKPDAAKKTQGDQYLFVNKRFIKSSYLNHAIRTAYEELITKDMFPAYFIFLEVDPSHIDINVHPTKTEIKFEDERLIYNYLRVSVKHSLGQYSLSPMLDFNVDHNFTHKYSGDASSERKTTNYHPEQEARFRPGQENVRGWEDIYSSMKQFTVPEDPSSQNEVSILESEAFRSDISINELETVNKDPFQLHNTYIIYPVKSGMMIIDQQAAHERILYEQYLENLQNGEYSSQKELFPRTIELDAAKASVLKNIADRIAGLGFDLEDFGHNTFIIHGTPSGLDNSISIDNIIEQLISNYVNNLEFELGIEDNLARSMAISSGIKKGRRLEKQEMSAIIDMLFACKVPEKSPSGKKCFFIQEIDEIVKRFNQ
ncbi:MAG: DNA mismatch repair endonuclease MutL [Saprospiraceae bacterium]|jgi:DNA mismatch repair protein MutL|nr:DNA mismatch repair endonuclease MutL [Saprospiraceae bacterium]